MDSEDTSLILNIRPQFSKEKKVNKNYEIIKEKPALVMKNTIVGYIVMYPLTLIYLSIFYTFFIMSYKKCRYHGLNFPMICFILSDLSYIVCGILNFVSMINRIIKCFDYALKLASFGLIIKILGWAVLWTENFECFEKRSLILQLSALSIFYLIIYWMLLYYLFIRINSKPWKGVFLNQHH